MAGEQPVRIAGLAALRRDLKAAEAYEELAVIGEAFGQAADVIRATAAAKAAASGRPVDARLADTYKVTKSKTKAGVRLGDKSQPWLIGQEWGAHRNEGRRVTPTGNRSWQTRDKVTGWRQFPEITKGGRFLYPAAGEKADEVITLLADAVERALTNPSTNSEGE